MRVVSKEGNSDHRRVETFHYTYCHFSYYLTFFIMCISSLVNVMKRRFQWKLMNQIPLHVGLSAHGQQSGYYRWADAYIQAWHRSFDINIPTYLLESLLPLKHMGCHIIRRINELQKKPVIKNQGLSFSSLNRSVCFLYYYKLDDQDIFLFTLDGRDEATHYCRNFFSFNQNHFPRNWLNEGLHNEHAGEGAVSGWI